MKSILQVWKVITLTGILLFLSNITFAEEENNRLRDRKQPSFPTRNEIPANPPYQPKDSLPFSKRFIHRIGLDVRPGYIIPTHDFFRGENINWEPIRNSFSTHVKYSVQFLPDSYCDRIYGGVYQGFGLAYYTFNEQEQLGDPIALYLFQGARIARIMPWLSFNYEWNFGLSTGWHPHDYETNYYNKVIGSRTNAYMNTNFYLSWMLSKEVDLTTGFTITHFSNGNTKFPNGGLNTVGLKLGLVYNFNRDDTRPSKSVYLPAIPKFPRHISYDLLVFGAWRRKGVSVGNEQVPSPEAYPVMGFNFAPMYNINYKLRAGVSLDGVYDGSANIYTEEYGWSSYQEFLKPPLRNQLALGLSGRGEYVMPYFTVGMGLGVNVLHGGGDLKAFYQILALKIEMTRSSFLHIGYTLQNFHNPSYLMLGIGYRFNNKYPTFHR